MRYYVVASNEDPSIKVHIVAEVVHDKDERSDERYEGLAGALAGPDAKLLSEAEILVSPDGARILREWNAGDDSEFDKESASIERGLDLNNVALRLHLHIVRDASEPSPARDAAEHGEGGDQAERQVGDKV